VGGGEKPTSFLASVLSWQTDVATPLSHFLSANSFYVFLQNQALSFSFKPSIPFSKKPLRTPNSSWSAPRMAASAAWRTTATIQHTRMALPRPRLISWFARSILSTKILLRLQLIQGKQSVDIIFGFDSSPLWYVSKRNYDYTVSAYIYFLVYWLARDEWLTVRRESSRLSGSSKQTWVMLVRNSWGWPRRR